MTMAVLSRWPAGKTLRSLFSARLLPLMLACGCLGIVLVVSIVSGITFLWAHLTSFSFPYADAVSNILVGGVLTVAGWFMLPALVVLIAGLFQDTVVHRIEKTSYPDAMAPETGRFWADLIHDLRFTLRAVFLNLLILPFYFLVIGPGLSVILNSYLLGREFFETAAGYHMPKSEARKLALEHRITVYGGGFLITLITLVPVLNLFVPIFALAYMVHLAHALIRTRENRS